LLLCGFALNPAAFVQTSEKFAWDGTEAAGWHRVPVVQFDFEAVFLKSDGERPESPAAAASRIPLGELLSPRELLIALAIARKILTRATPLSRASRKRWRDPVARQRMITGIRTALRSPEVRRRLSESALRAWRVRDREKQRQMAARVWRERRTEYLARMHRPEYRREMSALTRAVWADPVLREKRLAQIRSPESRQRISLGLRRYFEAHPEAREHRAEVMRRFWRDPVHRIWRSQRISAGWAAAKAKRLAL
jgi:hypothetical protein